MFRATYKEIPSSAHSMYVRLSSDLFDYISISAAKWNHQERNTADYADISVISISCYLVPWQQIITSTGSSKQCFVYKASSKGRASCLSHTHIDVLIYH